MDVLTLSDQARVGEELERNAERSAPACRRSGIEPEGAANHGAALSVYVMG